MIEETAAIPQAEIDHEVGATRQQIGPSVAILAEQGSSQNFAKRTQFSPANSTPTADVDRALIDQNGGGPVG
jgi:hypothetical protein